MWCFEASMHFCACTHQCAQSRPQPLLHRRHDPGQVTLLMGAFPRVPRHKSPCASTVHACAHVCTPLHTCWPAEKTHVDSHQARGQHCRGGGGGTVGAWGSGVERKEDTSPGHRHTQSHRISNTHACPRANRNLGTEVEIWGGPLYPQARAAGNLKGRPGSAVPGESGVPRGPTAAPPA